MDIAIIPAIGAGALIVWATYIRPVQERKKAEAARQEQLRLIDQAERQARNAAAELRRAAAAERERIANAARADRIEVNKPHVDDLYQLLNARLELARATQALADRETDPYKRIQLADKAARLYAQCNDISKKIDKLSR